MIAFSLTITNYKKSPAIPKLNQELLVILLHPNRIDKYRHNHL